MQRKFVQELDLYLSLLYGFAMSSCFNSKPDCNEKPAGEERAEDLQCKAGLQNQKGQKLSFSPLIILEMLRLRSA